MRAVRLGARGLAMFYLGIAVFERVAPARWVRAYQRRIGNPWLGRGAGFMPGWAVLETTGRRTGLPRQTPVGGRLRGDTYWTVAGEAGRSDFVKNLQADPHVRLKIHGRWRTGTAQVVPDDNPRLRLLRLNPANSAFLMIAAKDPATIRIDLDPV